MICGRVRTVPAERHEQEIVRRAGRKPRRRSSRGRAEYRGTYDSRVRAGSRSRAVRVAQAGRVGAGGAKQDVACRRRPGAGERGRRPAQVNVRLRGRRARKPGGLRRRRVGERAETALRAQARAARIGGIARVEVLCLRVEARARMRKCTRRRAALGQCVVGIRNGRGCFVHRAACRDAGTTVARNGRAERRGIVGDGGGCWGGEGWGAGGGGTRYDNIVHIPYLACIIVECN